MNKRKSFLFLFLFLVDCATVIAQPAGTLNRDSIARLTEADHQHMLQQLGIVSLRPGANGNDPNAPNAANYDESKANPFPTLPDALLFKNGKKVVSAKDWRKRRLEIKEEFDREVYGRTPINTPTVKWQIEQTRDTVINGIAATRRNYKGLVDNSSFPQISVEIDLSLTLPYISAGKVPVLIEFIFVFPRRPNDTSAIRLPEWQLECLKRGWGFATLVPTSIQADYGAGLTQGIIGLVNKGERRKPEDWGALKAWAWGASRVMDLFEKTPAIDARKVTIAGHSRYGKAALVTMAYDERFAAGYISSSGEAGAKLHRRNAGEIVENVAGRGEYHWMAGNFIKYAGPLTWNDLPVDSHELIALCAPRPLFIGSGLKGDGWVDPMGMFLATVAAGPVYRLLGKNDLGSNEYPQVDVGLLNGELAFRQHSAGHTPAPNWPVFIEFVSRYFDK